MDGPCAVNHASGEEEVRNRRGDRAAAFTVVCNTDSAMLLVPLRAPSLRLAANQPIIPFAASPRCISSFSPSRATTPSPRCKRTTKGCITIAAATAATSVVYSTHHRRHRLSCQPYSTMPSSIPPSASADADAAHSVRHLIGHPLPALIELESTSTKDGTLDLFMVSLSTPAVVFCFDASSTDVDESLRSLDEAVAALRAKEGAGEDGLHVFALCTNGDVEQLKQVKSDLKLSVSSDGGKKNTPPRVSR